MTPRGVSMLDVLTKHLTDSPTTCAAGSWVKTLSSEEQEAFAKLKENNQKVNVAALYKDLQPLPFGMTVFRSHLRGYCPCR